MHNINQQTFFFPNFLSFHNQEFRYSVILQVSGFFLFSFYVVVGVDGVLFYKGYCVVEYVLVATLMMNKWWFKTFQNINLLRLNKSDFAKCEGFYNAFSSWKVYCYLAMLDLD